MSTKELMNAVTALQHISALFGESASLSDSSMGIYAKNCKRCAKRNGCGDKKTSGSECTRYIPEKKLKRRR